MITQEMVRAGAMAMYAKTRTAQSIQWDLLPHMVQIEMQELTLAALNAAMEVAPKPES